MNTNWKAKDAAMLARYQPTPGQGGRPAPRNAEYAQWAIESLARENKSLKARMRMATNAIAIGNYTEAAKDEWRAYLAAGCPSL